MILVFFLDESSIDDAVQAFGSHRDGTHSRQWVSRISSRLPEQPIFYPVLTEAYATQIARDWKTRDEQSGFVGYVLRFQVRAEFLRKYDVHVVGSAGHREYWIPAGDLSRFNENIVGEIEIVSEFRGKAQGEHK
jgi:hypothetical protein